MSEVNKAVIQRMLERVNQHDPAFLTELYPDCVYHSPMTGELRGETFRRFVNTMFAAFPDCHWTLEDQFAEGDKVVSRWTFTGTHRGEFMGIVPTNKRVRVSGMTIDRVVNGKIVEEWEEWDTLGQMRQLGLVPSMAKVEEPVAA